MKKAGVIIFAIGLLITLITGFSFVTNKKVVEIGDFEISGDVKHRYN